MAATKMDLLTSDESTAEMFARFKSEARSATRALQHAGAVARGLSRGLRLTSSQQNLRALVGGEEQKPPGE